MNEQILRYVLFRLENDSLELDDISRLFLYAEMVIDDYLGFKTYEKKD